MATFDELEKYFEQLPDKIMDDAVDIVAEKATEYFKETFSTKEFDGNPWKAASTPKKTGSLMIERGALLNSIQPALITSELVVISAGNNKVNYAQPHNEGFQGKVVINPFSRKGKEVKGHTRNMNIPKRQFSGFNNYSLDNLFFSGVHDSRKSSNSKIQSSEAENGEANSNWSEAENGEANWSEAENGEANAIHMK